MCIRDSRTAQIRTAGDDGRRVVVRNVRIYRVAGVIYSTISCRIAGELLVLSLIHI